MARNIPDEVAYIKTNLPRFLQSKVHLPVVVEDSAAFIMAQERVFKEGYVWLDGNKVPVENVEVRLSVALRNQQNTRN